MTKIHGALKVFQKASQSVPAYQQVLKQHHINPKTIQGIANFEKLPILDKENYIYSFPMQDLFPRRKFPPMAYASSGSSGTPTFWFREDEQEEMGGLIHEKIFHDIFGISKRDTTLVVICFAMGVWIAGNYTLTACRAVSKKGYNITSVTPGIEQDDIMDVLRRLAPHFEHVILAGYPPFIMNVVSEARKRRIPLSQKIHIITAGDKFSEKWRSDLLGFLGIDNPLHSLISIYGSADAAVLGHETPFSIFLRRQALIDQRLSERLFGSYFELPGLVQYDPAIVYFEEINSELVLTANTASPLVRYNIHDIGKIIPYQEMMQILNKFDLEKQAKKIGLAKWKLPFLVLHGRTDVAATFYALNILPEHIRAGIEDRSVAKFLSGNFFVYNKTRDKSRVQKLYVKLELVPNLKPNQQIFDSIANSLVQNLLKWNIEFRKLHSTIGERALPIISVHEHGDSSFLSQRTGKGLMGVKGKKPRIIK